VIVLPLLDLADQIFLYSLNLLGFAFYAFIWFVPDRVQNVTIILLEVSMWNVKL